MRYHLTNGHLNQEPTILLVGCGGTGGFVAEQLCRLFTGRAARIILQDHDRVEPHNLLRQNFHPEDVGEFKSKALATRLSCEFQRPVAYSVYPFRNEREVLYEGRGGTMYTDWSRERNGDLMIGCVDNAAARAAMAQAVKPWSWYVDAGNGETWGQVLVGNSDGARYRLEKSFHEKEGMCTALPLPTLQQPGLLEVQPDTQPDIDCAAALDLTDQDPTINNMMAALVVQVVRRLVAGTCPWMALYLALETGTVTPVYATPENVSKITGLPVKNLVVPAPAPPPPPKPLAEVFAQETRE